MHDLCRVLPPWKRGEFLQELTRRMQGRELDHADLAGRRRRRCVRCSVAATPGCRRSVRLEREASA